jgi:hypothetical protein
MMVYFRMRFPVREVAKLDEYFCTGKRPECMRELDGKRVKESDEQNGHDNDENVAWEVCCSMWMGLHTEAFISSEDVCASIPKCL